FTAVALLIGWWEEALAAFYSGSADLSDAGNALLIALCSLPLTAATAVVTAWLQHRGRFLVPAFANAIFNSIILLTLWLAPAGLVMLASGIIAAALLRLLAHLLAFRRGGGGW